MNYAQAVEHLYGLGPELAVSNPADGVAPAPRRKFDLEHMRTLMHALGNPQTRVPAVLIAGTNGKGSTAATLASILTAAGYRTGLYTSPHLVRVNERIQLARPVLPSEYGSMTARGTDGELELAPIADHDYAHLYTLVDDACDRLVHEGKLPVTPSFFERLTAVAFLYFAGADLAAEPAGAQPRADIVVLEVGLGGRLDATNIVEPLLSVITDIALDHQDYLGNTIAEITREKCGILRANGTLITLPQLPEANEAIGRVAMELNVRGISAAGYVPAAMRPEAQSAIHPGLPRNRYTLHLDDAAEPDELLVDSPLPGSHQQRNIALALAAAIELRNLNGYRSADQPAESNRSSYKITNAALTKGIHNTTWPGRLELLAPNLLLDVAHNPAGAWTLRAALSALPPEQPRTLIFSCLRDKDLTEMAKILFPLFDSSADGDPARAGDYVLLAAIPNPRAAAVEDLAAVAAQLGVPAQVVPDLSDALALARRITPAAGMIVATGSVYLIGELRRLALLDHDATGGSAQ